MKCSSQIFFKREKYVCISLCANVSNPKMQGLVFCAKNNFSLQEPVKTSAFLYLSVLRVSGFRDVPKVLIYNGFCVIHTCG